MLFGKSKINNFLDTDYEIKRIKTVARDGTSGSGFNRL